jgi:hypothetical protein
MYQLRVKVIHQLGTFRGALGMEKNDATYENVKDALEVLQANVNSLDRLVIVHDDGTEMVFRKTILQEAVLAFNIKEIDE